MNRSEEIQARLQKDGWKPANAGAFMALAGPLWSKREAPGWVYGILCTDQHLNPAGIVHGGLLQTLIDHVLSTVAWEAADRSACVTVQLGTQMLAPVRADCLIEARGRLTRRTASLLFMQGELTVDGQEVLVAQAVLKIVAIPKLS